MLFHEIYGCYYNAVAEILHQAVNGELTEKGMQKIVTEKAFSESFLTVVPSLKDEKWQLLKKDLSTPIKHEPSIPLTDLQKRWLKAISLDPRVKLIATFWLIVVIFLCKSESFCIKGTLGVVTAPKKCNMARTKTNCTSCSIHSRKAFSYNYHIAIYGCFIAKRDVFKEFNCIQSTFCTFNVGGHLFSGAYCGKYCFISRTRVVLALRDSRTYWR